MIRVLVIDDSSICRASIASILEADGDISVIGEGEDAFSAIRLTESLRPDLVTMDVQMPGKSGLEAVEQIMARHPVPILVVTAMPIDGDRNGVAHTAVQNGALDIASKPSLTDDAAGEALRDRVRRLSKVPVFQRQEDDAPETTPPPGLSTAFEIVGVTSGRGGIASVIAFVSRLPADLPVPVVFFEPIPTALVPSYTQHLARICKLRVVVASEGEALAAPGTLLILPGPAAACTGKLRFRNGEGAFLRSLAAVHGERAAAVALAGSSAEEKAAARFLENEDVKASQLAAQLLVALNRPR